MSNSEIRDPRAPNNSSEEECAAEMHPEEIFARLQAQTRRHFLRSLTAGVGTMFLGTLASQFATSARAAELNMTERRASISRATLPGRWQRCRRNLRLVPNALSICTWRARPANWSFLSISRN